MSIWNENKMLEKIVRILDIQPYVEHHHFERPFLTPYQIAVRFASEYPDEFSNIGKPVGGKDTGRHDSFAQYIAMELSKRIKSEEINNIEGAFLFRDSSFSLNYNDIEATSGQSNDLSMYRLKK